MLHLYTKLYIFGLNICEGGDIELLQYVWFRGWIWKLQGLVDICNHGASWICYITVDLINVVFLMFLPVENPPSKWLDPILNRCFWVNDLWYLGEGLLQDNWLVVSWFLMKKNGNDDGQKWPLYTLRDDLKPCINQTIAHYQVPKIGLSGTVKIRTRNV